MKTAAKLLILPTPEQIILFWKSAGTRRWAYNYFLNRNQENYQIYLDNGKTGRSYLSGFDVRKEITALKKTEEFKWLKEVGSNVVKQAVKDAEKALKSFFEGKTGYPKFKSRHNTDPSFYVNYESLSRKEGGFNGEKLGFVKLIESLPKLKAGCHYSNPHISYDGKYWYLGIGWDTEDLESTSKEKTESLSLTGESVGIDLGIKELAVVYSKYSKQQKFYGNINKTKEVKRLKKKLKREQRKVSRKLRNNTDHYETVQRSGRKAGNKPVWKRPLRECENIQKQNKKINLINKRLTHIRDNHLHQVTTEIVKAKPSRIVIEDLNVKGLMKNKHLAEKLAEQKLGTFKVFIQYKAERRGIEIVKADRYYPSSKRCSCCGHKKDDLRLSDRVYKCESCGLEIDRDLNAAINLANYVI